MLFLGLVAQLPLASNCSAEIVRFGKPVAGAFTFALLDVGVRAGIFKRHGLDIEISAFTGGTRLVQAETAGSIDIAFNTGPDMAMIFKGAPCALWAWCPTPHWTSVSWCDPTLP
jgi:ABC-type nitrate/sulfonate/bicarbonate transport system substrate-binding protein